MRVIELECASAGSRDARISSKSDSTRAGTDQVGTGEDPVTLRATARIEQLLVSLCGDSLVSDQLRPYLPGLFSLTVAAYPPHSMHIQVGPWTS